MLKLPEPLRDQIAGYLKGVVVPAAVGADLLKIVDALSALEPTTEPDQTPDASAAEGR